MQRCKTCGCKLTRHTKFWIRPKIGLFPSFGPYCRDCAEAGCDDDHVVQAAIRVNTNREEVK